MSLCCTRKMLNVYFLTFLLSYFVILLRAKPYALRFILFPSLAVY